MVRTLVLVFGIVLAGALGFGAMIVGLERFGGNSLSDSPLEATRCEIELGPERCPGNPGFEAAKRSRIFIDDWEGAGSDVQKCLKRAADFFGFCKSTSQVTARFYKGRQLVRIETKK